MKVYTLQETNPSHLWEDNIIFKICHFRGCVSSKEVYHYCSAFQHDLSAPTPNSIRCPEAGGLEPAFVGEAHGVTAR